MENASLGRVLFGQSTWLSILALGAALCGGCASRDAFLSGGASGGRWTPAAFASDSTASYVSSPRILEGPIPTRAELLPSIVTHEHVTLDYTNENGAFVLWESSLWCDVPEGTHLLAIEALWPRDWPTWHPLFEPFLFTGGQSLAFSKGWALDPPPLIRVLKLP